MKKLFCVLISLCLGATLAMAEERKELVPRYCSLEEYNRWFDVPLENIWFKFNEEIKLLKGAKAVIKCGRKTVAKSTRIEVRNSRSDRATESTLIIHLKKAYLPKGKDYTLCVNAGAIASQENDVKNTKLYRSFSVPDKIDHVYFSRYQSSDTLRTTRRSYQVLPVFHWGIETEPVGKPAFILYREGSPIMEIPAHVGWDWNLGSAHPKLKYRIPFQKGVHYSLVLPAGSVRSRFRDDIVNEECVFNFVGGDDD